MSWRLSPHAFVRFWDVHAWAGIIGGLFLYVMFLTGAVTLFHEQLEIWEEPLAQRSSPPATLQATLERGLLAKHSTPDELWFYPPGRGGGEARLAYRDPDLGRWTAAWIDSERDTLVPERERLSGFIYRLHFLWHEATGRWLYTLSGLLAVVLLLALTTGVLIHLKDLRRQLHQFRIGGPRRVFWSDMHKVLGVMGLPFQVTYAYTGAFIVLAPIMLEVFVGPVFGGDDDRAAAVALGAVPPSAAIAGPAAPGLTLDVLADRARLVRPGLHAEAFRLVHHAHAGGIVEVWGQDGGVPSMLEVVRLRAVDGAVVADDESRRDRAPRAVRRWIRGLHFASFGGIALRVLFFFLALASCLTILSGNMVWLLRRESRRSEAGNRVLARLTVGVGAGAWVALGALFFASRLFPLQWGPRGTAEEWAFLSALGACVMWALTSREHDALWRRQLAIAGVLFLMTPVLAARRSGGGLFGEGPLLWPAIGVDAALWLLGAALLSGRWLLRPLETRAKTRSTGTARERGTERPGASALFPSHRAQDV
jgi:uncharacterized iron-regulated membrane protein